MESVLAVLGIKKIKAYKKADIIMIVPLVLLIAFNPVMILISALGGKAGETAAVSFFNVLIMMLGTAAEEVFFRGLLYGIFEKKRIFVPVIVSSLAFAAAHFLNLFNGQSMLQTCLQAFSALAAGLMFALSRAHFGRIFECMCVHVIINLTSLWMAGADKVHDIVLAGFSALLVIYGIILMVHIDRKTIRKTR